MNIVSLLKQIGVFIHLLVSKLNGKQFVNVEKIRTSEVSFERPNRDQNFQSGDCTFEVLCQMSIDT